jgi:hypothetical protein
MRNAKRWHDKTPLPSHEEGVSSRTSKTLCFVCLGQKHDFGQLYCLTIYCNAVDLPCWSVYALSVSLSLPSVSLSLSVYVWLIPPTYWGSQKLHNVIWWTSVSRTHCWVRESPPLCFGHIHCRCWRLCWVRLRVSLWAPDVCWVLMLDCGCTGCYADHGVFGVSALIAFLILRLLFCTCWTSLKTEVVRLEVLDTWESSVRSVDGLANALNTLKLILLQVWFGQTRLTTSVGLFTGYLFIYIYLHYSLDHNDRCIAHSPEYLPIALDTRHIYWTVEFLCSYNSRFAIGYWFSIEFLYTRLFPSRCSRSAYRTVYGW